jgi:hypothetical protein
VKQMSSRRPCLGVNVCWNPWCHPRDRQHRGRLEATEPSAERVCNINSFLTIHWSCTVFGCTHTRTANANGLSACFPGARSRSKCDEARGTEEADRSWEVRYCWYSARHPEWARRNTSRTQPTRDTRELDDPTTGRDDLLRRRQAVGRQRQRSRGCCRRGCESNARGESHAHIPASGSASSAASFAAFRKCDSCDLFNI